MITVSARDFKTSQRKYIQKAHEGEEVILTSRAGNVRLMPIEDATDSCLAALSRRAWKEHIEGKSIKFSDARAAQNWMDEL